MTSPSTRAIGQARPRWTLELLNVCPASVLHRLG